MRTAHLFGLLGVLALALPACDGGGGGGGDGGSGAGPSNPSNPHDAAAQVCVDTINSYRATLGLPAYERWVDQEICSNNEAQSDSASGTPHGAFGTCGELAQNECPGWPGKPAEMIPDCLAAMWAEGPGDFNGHGHYINMSNPDYTSVACGFFIAADNSIWAVQNFK